jgi:hypothetical protein
MAVSGKCGDHVGGRSRFAFAAGPRLEKGQYLSFARQFYGRVQRLADVRAVKKGQKPVLP